MKYVILVWLATLAVALQQRPVPEPRVDEATLPEVERRIPPDHYCKRAEVPISPREHYAHHCSCKMSCTVDEQGNITEHESVECLAYCHKNGRHCTCHIEEPCPDSAHGNAWMDMDGRVVAMKARP